MSFTLIPLILILASCLGFLMSSPTNSQSSQQSSFKLPKKEDMAKPLRLAAEARDLSHEELRYLFRELAKDVLDPHAEGIFTLCDNDGTVLGYFEPVRHHFRMRPIFGSAVEAASKEEFMKGSLSLKEFLERVVDERDAIDE